jgi:hypothetical protein
MLGLGIAIIVVTVAAGGGPLSAGVLLGLVFVCLGGLRLYMALRSQP